MSRRSAISLAARASAGAGRGSHCIGQGRPASEPEAIAEAYWRLRRERAEAELFYDDLPNGFQGLAGKFQAS